VLLPYASELEAVDTAFRPLLTPERIDAIVALIPDEWLAGESPFESVAEHRQAYSIFLQTRVAKSEIFVKEAQHARKSLI
jgi:hypothetical protein